MLGPKPQLAWARWLLILVLRLDLVDRPWSVAASSSLFFPGAGNRVYLQSSGPKLGKTFLRGALFPDNRSAMKMPLRVCCVCLPFLGTPTPLALSFGTSQASLRGMPVIFFHGRALGYANVAGGWQVKTVVHVFVMFPLGIPPHTWLPPRARHGGGAGWLLPCLRMHKLRSVPVSLASFSS
jgi:hypothetical protein